MCAIMFYLLLLSGALLCDGGLSAMEQLLARSKAASMSTSTVRSIIGHTCQLKHSAEQSDDVEEVVGVCVQKSYCRNEEIIENVTNDPATGFIARALDENEDYIDPDNALCLDSEICCKRKNVIEPEPVKEPTGKPIGCGYSNPDDKSNPPGPGYAKFAEFPWMVALILNNKGSTVRDSTIGGGTLIHPSVVMTVAHKVDNITNPNQLRCRAGELNLTDDNEAYKHQDRDISQIVIHPEYLRASIRYGVALLFLSSPFELSNSPHIGVACLEVHTPPPDTFCYSMGWGRDYDGSPHAAVLKKVPLPLVERQNCEELYKKSKLGPHYKLHHTLMCAGGEANVDTCVGDGGSSLVCPIQSGDGIRYYVVGMVGYGVGCGLKDLPAVYVKVSAIYEWVVSEMTRHNLNSTTFVY